MPNNCDAIQILLVSNLLILLLLGLDLFYDKAFTVSRDPLFRHTFIQRIENELIRFLLV